MISRSTRVLSGLVLASALWGAAAAAADGEACLARCDAPDGSQRLKESTSFFAEHLRSSYSDSYPAAVLLANSMAELAATLDSQLRAVEPTYQAFKAAQAEFDRLVRRSPLPRDPALGPVLPGFKRTAMQLETLLGCAPPAEATEMIPCTAIPLAHLLAVVGGQIDQYLGSKYIESFPDQAKAGAELDRAAKALHHLLHDLEAAVPGTLLMFEALDRAFESSMLTDADDVEDQEVKSRLAAVAESMAVLGGLVSSCHEAAESHEGH